MRRAYQLAAAALMLAGCMTSTSALLQGDAGANELRVVRTKTGLIWGPCMPAPGSVSSAYVIRLEGERSTYSRDEFRIYHELPSGAQFALAVDRGVIEIDRSKRKIRVDVTIGGKPCDVNGQFTFYVKDS